VIVIVVRSSTTTAGMSSIPVSSPWTRGCGCGVHRALCHVVVGVVVVVTGSCRGLDVLAVVVHEQYTRFNNRSIGSVGSLLLLAVHILVLATNMFLFVGIDIYKTAT
jgi:hypothetical protein